VSTTAAQEAYLRRWHTGALAGVTARAFGGGDCGDGRSSYEHLIDPVADVAGTVLDLGCGDGYLIERLAARRAAARVAGDAIGLDLSTGELAAARARLGAGAKLVHARAQAMPLAAGSVAAAVSHLAFTLMPEPHAIAAELARVIAPGGRFAAIVGGGPPAEREAFGAFLDLVRDTRARDVPVLGDDLTDTIEGWTELFGGRGFTIERFDRLEIDVGHRGFDPAWATVSTMYGVAELDAAARAELEARTRAAWAPYTTTEAGGAGGDRIRCAFVMWLAVASRSPAVS
jgi:SAM-dependent methyltransferase